MLLQTAFKAGVAAAAWRPKRSLVAAGHQERGAAAALSQDGHCEPQLQSLRGWMRRAAGWHGCRAAAETFRRDAPPLQSRHLPTCSALRRAAAAAAASSALHITQGPSQRPGTTPQR